LAHLYFNKFPVTCLFIFVISAGTENQLKF